MKNNPQNTRELLRLIEAAMSEPDWEAARRHITKGKGGLREFRRLVSRPIMESREMLSVLLADRPQDIESIYVRHEKNAYDRTTRSDDETAVRFAIIRMTAAGAIPGLKIHYSDGDTVGPAEYTGTDPPVSLGPRKRSLLKSPSKFLTHAHARTHAHTHAHTHARAHTSFRFS